ncbi:MAG: ribosome silencing factor [Deltaproteobacteria bacterium]|nr:MAG: ribosome silencing factor [Deltaproteobacteria bacterium]
MTETSEVLENIFECAKVAVDKRGTDLLLLDVGGLTSYTDYFLLVSATSDRRVKTIAESIRQAMKDRGVTALGVEGLREGRWALLDFGPWIVHVFYEEVRGNFDLEGLWSDASRVEIPAAYLEAGPGGEEVF